MYCVYIHTNKINNKKYIGLTSQEPHKRWRNGKGYKGSTFFHNAILKYGWDNFEHEVIQDGLSKEDAMKLEAELIMKYDTQNEDYGYNLESGGSAPKHSEHTKQMLHDMFVGRMFTKETKEKMRASQKLRPRRPQTEETKKRISKANKGHKVSAETREVLRKTFSQPVLCVELNKIFDSMTSAAEYFGLKKCTISAVIKGRNKTAAGYHWKLL